MRIIKTPSKRQLTTAVLLLALVFPLVSPEGMETIWPRLYWYVFVYARYMVYCVIALLFIVRVISTKGFKYDLRHAVVLIFAFFPLIPTALNGGPLMTWVSNYFVCVMTMMLMELYRKRLKTLLLVYLVILEFWIYLNFLCMIAFPGGMYYAEANHSYNCWLLGYKSSFQYYIIPAICLSWINEKYRKQRIRMIVLACVSMYEAVMSRNMMLAVALTGMLVIFYFRLYKLRICKLRNYLIAVLVVNAALLFFFGVFSETEIMSQFLNMIGKNSTLTSRASIIWPITLTSIAQNPITGYGVMKGADRAAMYHSSAGIHAHNQILEFAFTGGIVLLVLAFIMNLMLVREERKHRSEATYAISAGIFIIYLMASVEIYTLFNGSPVWLVILSGFFLKEIDDSFNNTPLRTLEQLLFRSGKPLKRRT